MFNQNHIFLIKYSMGRNNRSICMANIYSFGVCAFLGGRQSGAVLYNTFGVMGKSSATERGGLLASNNSSDSPTGSGYNTDVSEDNLPCDRISPSSDINGNSVSDEQVCMYLDKCDWF